MLKRLTHSTLLGQISKTHKTNRWSGGRFTTSTGHIRKLIPKHGDAFHLQVFTCKRGWLMHINIRTLLVCFVAVNNPGNNTQSTFSWIITFNEHWKWMHHMLSQHEWWFLTRFLCRTIFRKCFEMACGPIDCPNLLVDSNLKGDPSFRIFWNVFDSENSFQKCHFHPSQNCKTALKEISLYNMRRVNLLKCCLTVQK